MAQPALTKGISQLSSDTAKLRHSLAVFSLWWTHQPALPYPSISPKGH